MENSSSGDRQDRSGQNRQGQRGGRRRQNNRGNSRNSGGSGGNSNRRPRSGDNNGGKREYRPSNRGRQVVKKQTFLQKILSFLGLGGDTKSPAPTNDRNRSSAPSSNSRDSKRPAEKVEVTSERLYVGNLDYKTTGSDLEKHFSQIGTVKSAEIVINRRTQQSKGFAFVEMSSIEEARKAVSTYHNEDFMGRRMLVNGAKSQGAGGEGGERRDNNRRSEERDGSGNDRNRRNERGGERGSERNNRGGRSERREEPRRTPKVETPVIVTSSRLKLDNLDYEVGEEELEELFKGIGVVVSTEVISNPDTHQSKGYGFVEMSHIDEAKRAVEILNNKDFMGRKLNLSGAESKTPEASEASETPETTEVAETATSSEASGETAEDKQEKAAPAVES